MTINFFLNLANVILVVGYSVRDMLWLRLLAVASSFIALPYFFLQPTPLRTPILWSNIVRRNQSLSVMASLSSSAARFAN